MTDVTIVASSSNATNLEIYHNLAPHRALHHSFVSAQIALISHGSANRGGRHQVGLHVSLPLIDGLAPAMPPARVSRRGWVRICDHAKKDLCFWCVLNYRPVF